MKRRIIATLLALSMLTSAAQAANTGRTSTATVSSNDPFAQMYDSDILVDQLVENLADEVYAQSKHVLESEASIASAFELHEAIMERVELNSTVSLNLSDLQIDDAQAQEIMVAAQHAGENRFIVKYRSSSSSSIEDFLSPSDLCAFDVDSSDALSGSELVIFDEVVNPKELADILSSRSFGREIEYIQPDFKLDLATNDSFYLELTDSTGAVLPAADTDLTTEEEETTPASPSPDATPPSADAEQDDQDDVVNPVLPLDPAEPVAPVEPIKPVEPLLPVDPVLPIDPAEPILPVEPDLSDTPVATDTIIALIDTGVDINHTDLADRLWQDEDGNFGWNFCDDNAEVFDEENPSLSAHGTHVAGIIADQTEETQIMVLKAFDQNGAYTSNIIAAIGYAEENGATIVNCSFGSTEYNRALEDAISDSNLLFIAAAGNSRADLEIEPVYPACFDLDNVLCVTSINDDGGLSYFSNYSDHLVDLAAYGREIDSALPEDEHGVLSGTSMAAALVSGVAGAVRESELPLTASELKERLIDTADRYSNLQDVVADGRILNVENALSNTIVDSVTRNNPDDDFDVTGYQPTADEQYQLFSSSGKNIQIEATNTAIIVLKSDGTVWAWGKNSTGVCGETVGTYTSINQIVGLNNITKIAAGSNFCLALRADGTVWGWGSNSAGQLGNGGSRAVNDTPVQAIGLIDIVDIGAGGTHSLAVRSNGRLYTWGSNSKGQLGDGTYDDYDLPGRITLRNVEHATGGDAHSLAICSDGTVWSWGSNTYGQLGNSSTVDSDEPIESEMVDAVSIAAGWRHSVAVDSSGDVYAWGYNDCGELGIGTYTTKDYPRLTDMTKSAVMVAADEESSMALATDGTVWVWGENYNGNLGIGSTRDQDTPAQVSGLTSCVDIAITYDFGAALQSDGTVWVWGLDDNNVFGTDQYPVYPEPVRIPALEQYDSLFAGPNVTIGIDAENDAYGWGDNTDMMLGYSSSDTVTVPLLIDLINVESIDFGYDHTLGLKTNGRVYGWGGNSRGQLGDDTEDDSEDPVRAGSITGINQVAAGYRFSLALKSTGDVYAWGYNRYGQVANGDTVDTCWPEYIDSLMDIEQIAAGRRHGLALSDTGRVWSWGYNNHGQLGDGTTDNCYEAYRISYPRYVVQIDAGDYFSVALDEDGYVWTWGENSMGQLGNGTWRDSEEAEEIDISNVTEIAAGQDFCLALKSNGTVWGWGDNSDYQLATTDDTEFNEPIQIEGLSNIVHIVAGHSHCFAIDNLGRVYGWGTNLHSELGIPRNNQSLTPIRAHSMIPQLSFDKARYAVNIPTTGSAVLQLSATGNTDTTAITATMPTYSLVSAYSGVTLSSTGRLTVSSSVETGRVQVRATYGSLTSTTEIVLRKPTVENSNGIELSALQGEIYHIAFKSQNTESFAGKTFEVTYDSTLLAIDDLCALTYNKEASPGAISRTGVTITECTPGTIRFTVDKEIPSGKKWSGLVNLFTFKALADGEGTIQLAEVSPTASASQ